MLDEVGVAEVSHYVAKTPVVAHSASAVVRRCTTRAVMRAYENAKDQRKRFPAPLLSLSRSRWRPRDKRIKSTLVCSPFPVRYPPDPARAQYTYIHILCCRRLRPLHSFILISIYLLESRPTPAVPALHRPSRGKPPRLSRRFKQNHCHRRRHSAARAASRRLAPSSRSHAKLACTDRARERGSEHWSKMRCRRPSGVTLPKPPLPPRDKIAHSGK